MPTDTQNGHADLLQSFSSSRGDGAGWLIAGTLASGPQALVEVVQKTADGYFKTAYKIIGIVWGTVLLAVGAEMAVYFRWYLPKRAGFSAD